MSAECSACAQWPTPLQGWLPWTPPGEPLVLWRGPIRRADPDTGSGRVPGLVTLTWKRRPRLEWCVDTTDLPRALARAWHLRIDVPEDPAIIVDFAGISSTLRAGWTGDGTGYLHGGDLGDSESALTRVVAHWVNLPSIPTAQLHQHTSDGDWESWPGRTTMSANGWRITIDARPDHGEVYKQARADESFAITHVMELRRDDASPFLPADARAVLHALQVAVSFALGRWVSPVVPVGYDRAGHVRWTQWGPAFGDPPAGSLGWWNTQRPQDLAGFLDAYLAAWNDPDFRETLSLATMYAITSVQEGFVEQRIIGSVIGLELLAWHSQARFGGEAKTRIRALLTAAAIDPAIPANTCPDLSAFARRHSLGDGANTIAGLRHRLTHPKNNRDLYATKGTLQDGWRLALRYLELVLLHRIGYGGHVADRTHLRRWRGESAAVPWTAAKPSALSCGNSAASPAEAASTPPD